MKSDLFLVTAWWEAVIKIALMAHQKELEDLFKSHT